MKGSTNTSSLKQLEEAALILCLEAEEAGLDCMQVHQLIKDAYKAINANKMNRLWKGIPAWPITLSTSRPNNQSLRVKD